MKVGDWVQIVLPGKLNFHINCIGYIGKIVEINEWAAQVHCGKNGCGAIELERLRLIEEPSYKVKNELHLHDWEIIW